MFILTYHRVEDRQNFEKQISYLVSNKYSIISISEFAERFADSSLTSRDVLITFDDGHRSVLDNGLPILKKFGCPALMFVITSLIDTEQPFWWEEISYYTNDVKEIRRAKSISNDERVKYLVNLRSKSNLPSLKYKQLTLPELRFMEENGIAIGNHSHTHPMLDKLSSEELQREVLSSQEYLKTNNFKYYDVFAYPNGNYSDEVEKSLLEINTRFAFLFNHRINETFDNPLRISRLSVNDNAPLWKFKLIMSGWHSRMLPTIKAVRKLIP